MDIKALKINNELEEKAQKWKEKDGGLLDNAGLWHAGKYVQSRTSFAAGLSEAVREYVSESMRINQRDFEGTARLKDNCRGCGSVYRSSNLLICVQCSMERCGGCASRLERNDQGDPICPFCKGVLA